MPIPDTWHVHGSVFGQNGPASSLEGNIYLYGWRNGSEYWLANANFNAGNFTLTFARDQFQFGNAEIAAPDVIFRIYDYQGNLIWQYGPVALSGSDSSLNPLLGGGIVAPEAPQNWELGGKIKKHDQTPMASGRVDVWDVSKGREIRIGSCDLDSSGDYSVAFTKQPYPQLQIRVYDPNGIMVGYSGLICPDSERYQYDLTLAQTASLFHVSGKISNTAGYPVSGCVVIVKNISLLEGTFLETELGRTVSGETLQGAQGTAAPGVYDISFHPDLVANLGALDQARFVVEVYTMSGEAAGKSALLKATGEKLSADFAIDAPSSADVSTFTAVNSQLSGFGESSIIELAYDESKLEYAAELTGESKEELLAIALAASILSALKAKLAGNSGIPDKVDRQVMYALVKTGNAECFQDILKITAGGLQTILISAITQSIVPPSVQDSLSDIVSEWERIYSMLLTEDADKSNAGRIFRYAMPKPENGVNNEYSAYYEYYSTVVEAYAENAHALENFWTELEEKLSGKGADSALIARLIGRLKFFFDIHRFADEFGPLSSAMMEYADEEGYVTLEDFVELEKTEWLDGIIEKIEDFTKIKNPDKATEWPESVPGESDDEKRSNYASILYKRIIELFPMNRFRSDFGKAMNDAGFGNSAWWQPVHEFLNVKTAFDFADAIADDDFYCDSGTEDELHYISDFTEEEIQELYGKLLIVQRLYRLTPKFKVIDALIEEEFTSAMSIAHKNCDEFAEKCSELVGGIDDAQALHAAAVHTASQALFLMGTFNQQTDLPQSSIPAVTERHSEPEQKSLVQPLIARKRIVPNIATLFGSQNQCLCPECQSVFSPSAYMVDLLEFLSKEVRDELFSRRPDLSETDLSCRNTNGAVAYIDLVNEILEDAVCHRSFGINDSEANWFLSTLRNKIGGEIKSSFVIENIPSAVINEFGGCGFYIDKGFYVQGIKDTDKTKEINSKWYIIGDSWRYLVELSAGNKFLITPYPQTGKDAQLRRVKPEHTHRGAYGLLKQSIYPANLPFNLPFTEVNEFLKLKKSNRYELRHALRAKSGAFEADEPSMLAFFEMTDRQKDLIIGNNAKVWELWGVSSENELLVSLGNAESVMKKLDITLDRFLDLMHTYFVARPSSDDYIYLDWGNDDAYENGELDKLSIKKNANGNRVALADYSRIARLQRLSIHLGLDAITVDRLIAMQSLTEIDGAALINLFKCLKIAEEFSVSPIRASSWLCCWIENFNLGRGAPSQFEELFLSNIDAPERAAVWKEMMNDIIDGSRAFITGEGTNEKDIATLLKGLKVNYHDLSLIAHEEFDGNSTDAKTILSTAKLTVKNLAKMFRAADFSRVLGIPVSDFYKLKSILSKTSIVYFSPGFLIECRSFLAKLKKSKISIAEFQYLLSGENEAEISWLPTEDAELKAIIKTHDEVVKTKLCHAEDSPDLADAVEETILNELAAVCKISVDTCRTVLEKTLKGDSEKPLLQHWVDICAHENAFEGIGDIPDGYLAKIANVSFLIRTLKIAVDEFDFLADYLPDVYGLDFDKLGTSEFEKYESLIALLDAYILGGELPFRNKNFTIFDLLREAQKSESETDFRQLIAREIDWQHEDIFNFSLAELRRIDSWSALNNACGLLKRLGLTASFASSLISKADNSPEESEALIGALKAGYTQPQWIEAAEPIRNNLRRLQRDALCAHLLGKGFANRAAIYAKYLIDVNMDTDVMTTRIVQANSSIQMLLQRALLNFEDISLDDKTKQQWAWMKNYRLWEASRKIFLYPENWLEPEFRDDKTPLFKELESAMLQKELNPPNIREAFKTYASGLSEIANLEVIGAYSEEGQDGKVLHVIGRTFHYPHSYYYRRHHDAIVGSGYWTPWEKVDLDITADVVLPVPFRNKIYIFWPLIEVKEKAVGDEDRFKHYEIKLAWSEFSEGKWSAKRISQNAYIYIAEGIDNELVKPTDHFHFKAEIKSDEVEIQVFAYNKTVEEFTVKTIVIKDVMRYLFGVRRTIKIPIIENKIVRNEKEAISKIAVFSFGSDNSAKLVSVPEAEGDRNYMESEMIPPGTTMCHNCAEESEASQNLSNFGALEYPAKNVLLKRTPEQFTCFPVNLSFFDSEPKPFFLRLRDKTLFVKPIIPSANESPSNAEQTLDSANKTCHQIVNFYHPLADDLVKRANIGSIDDLLNRSVQANAKDQYPLGYAAVGDEHAGHLANLSFQYQYLPQKTILGDYPVPTNDFSLSSAFGVYNWELFFHLPMYIAARLSHDSQYEEAMRWFHYIFNPAIDFTTWEKTQRWTWDLPEGARFWNFLPFFANRGVQDSIYKAVEKSQMPDEDTRLGTLIEDWKNDPFKPHLIARVRTAAYQKSVVMKYLDNFIAWGDSLFRLDNMESINEATQLYTQASEILGDRPVLVPKLHEMPGLTYAQLKAEGLDQFSNTVIQLENYIPPAPPIKVRFWRAKQAPSRYYYYHYNYNYTYNSSVEAIPQRSVQLLRMAPALHYFCIPRNERLLSYWDIVEDRLFKIRHSMNIDGVKRVMPLFAPPIDPGMLAKASAMGISIGALLKDMQSAPSAYRFATVFQKALELCNELKAFGAELLSALEKKDAEGLAFLRSNHEIELLKLVKDVKKKAAEESAQNLEALLKTKAITEERYNYYKEIERTSEGEVLQLASSGAAAVLHEVGQAMVLASSPVSSLPDGYAGALVGVGGGALAFSKLGGGEKAGNSMQRFGSALVQSAGILDRIAGVSGTVASYNRRWQEWKLQEKLAHKELAQIDKQILCAQIRVQMAEKDLSNHERQIEQAQALKEVMESKFSNEKLYQWMADELNKSYNALYDIAYSAAKKAEKAFQFELGNNKIFVSPEIWDSAKNGLLAGSRLSVQLRKMDAAYMENNKREFEITKAVSLNMLEPYQLLVLRETGFCKFELPEMMYDLDCPGQYFRRIKSVRVTIPCVAGPYTSISAKLTLLSSRVRASTDLKDGKYKEEDSEIPDSRFLCEPIPIGASISTSGAMMDSGMFDFNFRDERYLPFEGAGAISRWSLELPANYRQFDYGSIADVVLHVSYTAREAMSPSFKNDVAEHLDDCLGNLESIPNLISLSQSFHEQFESITSGETAEISLNKEEHFPHLVVDYWRRNGNSGIPNISELKVFVLLKNRDDVKPDPEIKVNGILAKRIGFNLYEHEIENIVSVPWSLLVEGKSSVAYEIEDVFLYFGYSLTNG
jgi:hypothetical protein